MIAEFLGAQNTVLHHLHQSATEIPVVMNKDTTLGFPSLSQRLSVINEDAVGSTFVVLVVGPASNHAVRIPRRTSVFVVLMVVVVALAVIHVVMLKQLS